jgi:N-terminal half of MaoC dehydratase
MAIERFPIEAGHVMMFARAIGDPNPVYADADVAAASEAGAIPAPPTFVTASAQFDPDYPLRPKAGEPWFGSGREATGAKPSSGGGGAGGGEGGGGGTSLHAEQHYEYHRPLVVGDVLHARGRKGDTWEKQGRSGTLKFTELITEYLDADDEVVITARTVAVLTEGPK